MKIDRVKVYVLIGTKNTKFQRRSFQPINTAETYKLTSVTKGSFGRPFLQPLDPPNAVSFKRHPEI